MFFIGYKIIIYIISFSCGSLIISLQCNNNSYKFYQSFCYDFRLGEILAECKEGTELKKILNPHFGK